MAVQSLFSTLYPVALRRDRKSWVSPRSADTRRKKAAHQAVAPSTLVQDVARVSMMVQSLQSEQREFV